MKIIACLFAILLFFSASNAGEWCGIKPLYSTRQDVERILGMPDEKDYSLFKLEKEVVIIDYSNGVCSDDSYKHYNVPKNTVLSFTVHSKWIPLSKLTVDKTKFKLIKLLQPNIFWYSNEEEGIRYDVRNDMVISAEYLPTANDNHLLCPAKSQKPH
jgi:hypothetical protein